MEFGSCKAPPSANEPWSPTSSGATSALAPSPSTSSICSGTALASYGYEMNWDYEVLISLEEKLGRELEHDEVRNAIAQFQLVYGQAPTLKQLAWELGNADSPQPAGINHEAMLVSPSACSQIYACTHTHSRSGAMAGSSRPSDTEKEEPEAGNETPAFRPFVPGLNLRVLKKSPTIAGGPSPPAATTPAHGPVAQGGATTAKHAAETPDSCSPTQIFRVLMPTACKPRGGNAVAWQLRAWGQYTPTHTAQLPPRVEGPTCLDVQAEWDDAAAGEVAVLEQNVCRQLGRLRVSVDDLDQQDGPRRTSPAKTMDKRPAAGAGSSPDAPSRKGTPQATPEKEKRTTPGSRGRRHGSHGSYQHHHVRALSAGSGLAMQQATAKRQLRLAEADGDDDCVTSSKGGGVSLVDSDLRTDTPNKGFNVSLAAAAATATAHTAVAGLAQVLQPGSNLVVQTPDARDTSGDHGGSSSTLKRASSQGPSPVPPLRLPPQLPLGSEPGTGLVRSNSRPRARCASSGSAAAVTSSRVPPLPLATTQQRQHQGRAHALQTIPASGARGRRLSICLPSSMVYGEGPLTARRMAAKATSGITSHALCTVFWAESEDELADFDSDLTVTDDDDTSREDGAFDLSDGEYEPLLGGRALGTNEGVNAAASHVFTAAAVAAAAAGAAAQLGSPESSAVAGPAGATGGRHQGQQQSKGRRGGRRRHRLAAGGARDDEAEDSDRCGRDLMLPEELWDAWERLSDGPKGRQYRLLESLTNVQRITCTSYSTVSKACHQGQPVVVKIYDVAERDKLANAFAEIGVLLHLSGWPGAVRLLDYGRHEDKVMLMLESCDRSLKDWCDSRRYSVDTGADYIIDCLRLWRTLAELLAELHERWHVAHCDLKPGNVLLSGDRLLLADFSESMLFNETPLLLDQSRGTLPYQPPEMVHRHCVDARKADVWAMGCILYEVITGELLFKGNSDCMRAVTVGTTAATRQRLHLHHRHHPGRNRAGGSSGGGVHRRLMKRQHQPQPHCQRALAAEALHVDSSQAGDEPMAVAATTSSWDQGTDSTGWDAPNAPMSTAGDESMVPAAAAPAADVPLVPRLPLVLSDPPISAAAPWQSHPTEATVAAPLPALVLPGCLILSSRSGLACGTGRSLELIVEGYGTEDALSMASEPWVLPSAGHTAPTTARSTARDTARTHAPVDTARSHIPADTARSHVPADTARSLASNSTAAAWPPPPPPSAGTARSVADSEWTLAVPTTTTSHLAATTAAGTATRGYDLLAPYGIGIVGGSVCEPGLSARSGTVPEPSQPRPPAATATVAPSQVLLPPHCRLRHSVATQCADPAGPDWMTTEEADRMRIMADEPPSFILVHSHGGGTHTGGTATVHGGSGGCSYQCDLSRDGAEAAISAVAYGEYKARRLSGADGPSLCDDVLGLLRAVLVEDFQRPTMREVARMVAEVLMRHEPQLALAQRSAAQPEAAPEDALPAAALSTATVAGPAGGYLATGPLDSCGPLEAWASGGLAVDPQEQLCGGASVVAIAARSAWLGAAGPPAGPGGGVTCAWPAATSAVAAAAMRVSAVTVDGVAGGNVDDVRAAMQCPLPPPPPSLQQQPVALPRLRLASLQGQGPPLPLAHGPCDVGSAPNAHIRVEDLPAEGSSTGGSSWTDGSSLGGADVRSSIGGARFGIGFGAGSGVSRGDGSGGGDGGGDQDAGGVTGCPRAISLFDICQPLVTSRNSRPYSRSWQRFLTKQ